MLHDSLRPIALAMAGLLTAGGTAVAEPTEPKPRLVRFANLFEDPREVSAWTAWTFDSTVAISHASPGYESGHYALFSTGIEEWNTPILKLPRPVAVDDDTVIEFDIWTSDPGDTALNIENVSEGNAEYQLPFRCERLNNWSRVRLYLKHALYRRGGAAARPKDGLVGDGIGSIQIAVHGREVRIDNFRILDYREPVEELSGHATIDIAPQVGNYPILNEVFPFGVISTVNAGNIINGKLFGQETSERVESDLLDIKRRHFNVYVNFCDDENVADRLELMDRFGLYLIETAYSNHPLAELPDDHPAIRTIDAAGQHPRLLAWYGRDEPADVEAYLRTKLRSNAVDPRHLYISAFASPHVVQALGPHLEAALLDPYVLSGEADGSEALLSIMDYVRQSKAAVAGQRIWLVPQAFSLRKGQTVALREPQPEEMRLSVYSAIAAGAQGFLFFIYNDTASYLDGTLRPEEFDQTLVDPWGNPAPMHEELGRIARRLIPVMPALLGAAPISDGDSGLRVDGDRVVQGAFANGRGAFVVLANPSLSRPATVELAPSAAGARVYNLLERDVAEAQRSQLTLEPGAGAILFVGSEVEHDRLRVEIATRVLAAENDLLRVELDVLRRAGFEVERLEGLLASCDSSEEQSALRDEIASTAKVQPSYVEAQRTLEGLQAGFGEIHDVLMEHIVAIDATTDPRWLAAFEELKATSRDYFAARRQWERGVDPAAGGLQALSERQRTLKRDIQALLGTE